jgi:hypothetical protein
MTTAVAMTYDTLVSDVLLYLDRTDAQTTALVPTFIMLAEQVIAAQIKFLGNLTVAQSNMVVGQAVVDKPARWHKTVSMNIVDSTGARQPVLLRKYEYVREYWPDSTTTGLPQFYSDYDYTHWLVAPTPASASAYEVLYYERVQPLDSSNQTNWFTIYAPQALLYGTLLQAMPYLKNDERMGMWQQQYDLIINTLKSEDVQRIGDRHATVLDT